MKSIAAVALLVTYVLAEPPPSNSYLPPPPNRSSNAGYPQASQNSLPQVVAARSQEQGFGRPDHGALGHGAAANGFARSNLQAGSHGAFGVQGANGRAQPRFNDQGYEQKGQGYDQNAAALARNALEGANEPANYNFAYMVNDYQEGTDFGHHEERQEERAQGEYHVVLPDGRKQTVSYEADEGGFKPQISYEDTEDLARSGYDSNANNFHSNGYPGNEHGHQGNDHGHQGNEHGHQGNEHGYQGNDQNGGYASARNGY